MLPFQPNTVLTATDLNEAFASKAAVEHEHVKAQVGLGNVDNTSDVDKPVSTAQQTALDLKTNIADLASTEAGKGAALVGFKQEGVGAVERTVEDELRDRVATKQFGAINATEDSRVFVQNAINQGSGKPVTVNAGNYLISFLNLIEPLKLIGEGKYLTKIKRNGASNLINSTVSGYTEVSDLSVDMDKSNSGNDGHGIVFTQAYSKASNVSVKDYGSTLGGGGCGVIFYGDAGRKNCRLLDSEMIGNDATMIDPAGLSYGWLMEDNDVSFVRGIYAKSIKNYAHELKNTANNNIISDIISENSGTALGYGQDIGSGPYKNIAHGILSKSCDVGFTNGYSNYNLISCLLHDNTDAPNVSGTSHLARFNHASSFNSLFGAVGIGSFVDTVRYEGNANYAQIVSHDTSSTIVNLQPGSGKNATEVAHPGTRTSIRSSINDSSGNSIKGVNANPVWCHATGERIGSISGRFWDKLGVSGATPNSNHYWVKESDQYAINVFATPGNSGDQVGISYATPASFNQGSFLYGKSINDDDDSWSLRVGNTNSYRFYKSTFRSETDNVRSLGTAATRWSVVYAATGTINTSDSSEKQQVRELSETERAVAVRLKTLVRAFKFNEAVDRKGDAARIHFGVIAQEVKAAFEAEGLTAEDYAILCYDEWEEQPEVKDEDGNVTQEYRPAGNRYGVRYEELLAFIISAL